VGDCYFLASLILLDEQIDLTRGIFTDLVENEAEAVNVNWHQMGERKSIIVKTRLLFKNNRPKFARPLLGTDSWWYRIAEKAFMKAASPCSSIIIGNQHVGSVQR
jgi:hypothetical protein